MRATGDRVGRLFNMSRSVLTFASSRRMRSYSWLETFSLPPVTSASTLASLHHRPSKFAPMPRSRYRRLAHARLAYQLDCLALKLF